MLISVADYLKVVVTTTAAGRARVSTSVLGDLPRRAEGRAPSLPPSSPRLRPEKGLADLTWPLRRLRRRARRALTGGAACRILPGIDIDIPTGKDQKKTEPEDVGAATAAALEAGAHGVVFSRKYSEMRLANLSAGGRAVREFKA
jgi:hypothetical protein